MQNIFLLFLLLYNAIAYQNFFSRIHFYYCIENKSKSKSKYII